MKNISCPSHVICSKFFSSLLSYYLIHQLEEGELETSWEVAFLQLEVEHENELEASSLDASH